MEESFLPEEILATPIVADAIPQNKNIINSNSGTQAKPLWKVEMEMIKASMIETQGNVVKASKILEIGQASLYRKLKTYGINKADFTVI